MPSSSPTRTVMVESTSFLENATWVSWRTVTMEKMKLIIFLFFSVCQAPFISNKCLLFWAQFGWCKGPRKHEMEAGFWLFSWCPWSHMWHFGDLQTHRWQRPFGGTFATCSCWLKVYGLVWQFLLFQVGFTSFSSFGKKSLCIWLGRRMFTSRVDWRREIRSRARLTALLSSESWALSFLFWLTAEVLT